MLDIYAGPLCRYYVRDWKTQMQAAAESMGIGYKMIGPGASGDESAPPVSSADLENGLNGWIHQLTAALEAQTGQKLTMWTDRAASAYFTAQLTWPAYYALILSAAYNECPDMIQTTPDFDDIEADNAYKRVADKAFKSAYQQLTKRVELWFPCALPFVFEVMAPNQVATMMGSVPTLKQQLHNLNAATWDGNADEIKSWRKAGPPAKTDGLEILSKYSFSILMESANFCIENNVPMKLDY